MLVKSFRWMGYAEAASFLILVLMAMPLKYIYGQPEYVRFVGSLHGGLFMTYIGLAFAVSDHLNWPRKKLALAFIAAVIPLGPILFDKKLFKA